MIVGALSYNNPPIYSCPKDLTAPLYFSTIFSVVKTRFSYYTCFAIFCIIILLAPISLTGCNVSSGTTTSTTKTTSTSKTTSSTTITTDSPIFHIFKLSRAPKLGQTTELTFKVTKVQPQPGISTARIWLDFYWINTNGSYAEALNNVKIPLEEVVVGGETDWEGDYNESLVDLRSTIKITREGIWNIRANFSGEGESLNQKYSFNYWLAVAEGTSEIMNKDIEEFKAGPLGYLNLGTFPGGGAGYNRVPSSSYPFTIGLDISKAPKAGEEVTLTCRVLSSIDMANFSIKWSFSRRTGGKVQLMPSTDFLTSADLSWKTDIKKDVPAVFSTTFKFPSEGEWEVRAKGNYEANLNGPGSSDFFSVTITPARSYFGWAKLPTQHGSETSTTFTTTTPADMP